MTGFDHEWKTHPGGIEKQKTVLTVHYRPDKKPKDKAEWFEWLSGMAKTMAELYRINLIGSQQTGDRNDKD